MKKLYFLLISLVAIVFTIGAQNVLYVGLVAENEMLPSDSFTVAILEDYGYTITYVEDDVVDGPYNYSSYDAVFYGESCSSSKVVPFGTTSKYPLPCVILEPLAPRSDKWGWVTWASDNLTYWKEDRDKLLGCNKIQIKDNTHYITSIFEQDEVLTWSNAPFDSVDFGMEFFAHGFDLTTFIPAAVPLGQNMSSGISLPCLWALEANTPVTASDTLKHRLVIWGLHAYGIADDKDDRETFGTVWAGEAYEPIIIRSLQWVLGANVGIHDVEKQQFQVAAYPNPVNDYLKLEFSLDKPEMVSVNVINIVGQTIETIEKQYMSSGLNKIEINTTDLHGGLYMFILEAGSKTYTGKFNVVR